MNKTSLTMIYIIMKKNKTYLVKKNVDLPGDNDNWIIMNGYEFAMFMETEDGQKRKKNFAKLERCDDNDYDIVIECDEETARTWECERLCRLYHRRLNAAYTTISYDYPLLNDENCCGEDMIPDPSVNVEDAVSRSIMKEFLHEALALLNEEDEAILRLLYLSDNPVSAKEYGEMLGICESYVHKKKTEALKRLKSACSRLRYKKLLRNADEVES